MARKTTGKRLLFLDSFFGMILRPDSFNNTTKKLKYQLNTNLTAIYNLKNQTERKMYMNMYNLNKKDPSQKSTFLYLFNEGTLNINNIFKKSKTDFLNANENEDINDPLLSDEAIEQTTIDLLYVFSTQQPWYLTYLFKKPLSISLREEDTNYFDSLHTNFLDEGGSLDSLQTQNYLKITTESHQKCIQNYYSPAVLIKKLIEKVFSDSELSEIRKNNQMMYPLMSNLDQDLSNEIRPFLGLTSTEIPQQFTINIKNLGLKLLITNFEYTVPISSLTTVGMSVIFKLLPLNKQIIKFLHKHGASLSVIELYEKLQNNPVLFFDLKKQAVQINNQTLLKLEGFIKVYNSAFLPGILNSKATFTPDEMELLKKQNAFLYVDNSNTQMLDIRIKIHNALSNLSKYVFPVNAIATNLSFLQLQNILLLTYLIFLDNNDFDSYLNLDNNDYESFLNNKDKDFGTYQNKRIKNVTFFNFLNTFTDFRKLYDFSKPITVLSKKSTHNALSFALLFSILLGEKIKPDFSINTYINRILDNIENQLPILNIPLQPRKRSDTIIYEKTRNKQELLFSSMKFFLIGRSSNFKDFYTYPITLLLSEVINHFNNFQELRC